MKALSCCLMLLLAGTAFSQDIEIETESPFGNGDVIFGTEGPDKDALPTDPPEDKPTTESTEPPTEEVKPAAPLEPDNTPTRPALPEVENCTGVTCDLEAIRDCPAPVLFAKQCCPVCPELDACNGVMCNDSEVCTVNNGQAICCTDFATIVKKRAGARGLLQKARCRFELENDCTLRFVRSTTLGGTCGNITCNSTEKCTRLLFLERGRYSRRQRIRSACCSVKRPECPAVTTPTVLGKCRLPGEPVRMPNDMCNCTTILSLNRTSLVSNIRSLTKITRRQLHSILRGFGGRRGYRHGRSIGRFYYSGFYNRFRSLVRRINSANSKFACLPVTYKYSSASGVHQIQRCTCTCEPRTAFEVRVRGSRPCKQMKYLSRQCRRE